MGQSNLLEDNDVSIEGQVDGKARKELEYTFYGKVADLSQLGRAIHKEVHEQWSLKLDTDKEARVRIRAINNMRWIMTTKYKYEGVLGWEEVECDISKDMFEHLKKVSERGYFKTRYNFRVEGSDLLWELDVFKDINGQDHPWVKLDLEVSEEIKGKFPKLPVDFVKGEFIAHQNKEQTEQESGFIKNLWKKEWVSLDENQHEQQSQ